MSNRFDLFKFSKDVKGSEYKFEHDEEAVYSATPYHEAVIIAKKFKEFEREKGKTNKLNLFDATSNVVGPVIFGLTDIFDKIYGAELSPSTFKMLSNNLKMTDLKNVEIEQADALSKLDTSFLSEYPYVFFDPPWGGRDYKEKEKLDLFLSNRNIGDIVDDFLKYAKLVAVKVPTNYNVSSLKNDIYHKLEIKRGGKVSYIIYYLYNKDEEEEEDINLGEEAPEVGEVKEEKEAKGKKYVQKYFSSAVFPLHPGLQNKYKGIKASEETFDSVIPFDIAEFIAQKIVQTYEYLIISGYPLKITNYPSLYLHEQGPVTPLLFSLSRYFSSIYAASNTKEAEKLLEENKKLMNEDIEYGPHLDEKINTYGCAFFTANTETEVEKALSYKCPIVAVRVPRNFKVESKDKKIIRVPVYRRDFIQYEIVFIIPDVKSKDIIFIRNPPNIIAKDSIILRSMKKCLTKSLGIEKAEKYVNNETLLHWRKAFISSSANPGYNYEKVEFSGDANLAFIFTRLLMSSYPNLTAREYSDLKQVYTNNYYLAYLLRSLGLQIAAIDLTFPIFPSIAVCADIFEAIIGTLWTVSQLKGDNGFIVTYDFVKWCYDNYITIDLDLGKGNYKSRLHQIMERLGIRESYDTRRYKQESVISVNIYPQDVAKLNQLTDYLNTNKGGKYKKIELKKSFYKIRSSGQSLREEQAEALACKEMLIFLNRFGINSETVNDFYRQRILDDLIKESPVKALINIELQKYKKVRYDVVNDITKDKLLYRLIGTREAKEELITSCVWKHNQSGDKIRDPVKALLFALLR
jgi:dsRNA-specific ribonuclease/predicted RNA methylase